MKQIIFLLFLLSCTAVYAQQQDSVTIHGRVTDYNGQPIDSASVWWQNPQFNDIPKGNIKVQPLFICPPMRTLP